MKKLHLAIFTAAIAVSAFFAGCTRDMVSSFNGIQLSAERFNGGDKAYINDDRYACWENNDAVKLNVAGTNYDGTISVSYPSGSPHAEANATGFSPVAGQTVYAGYPRALFQSVGVGFNGGSKTITLPNTYTYEVSNGHQKITAPMVGQITIAEYPQGSTNPNVLKMINLCSLLKIRLDAPSSGAFTVDSIVVVNTSSASNLSGNFTVSYPLNGSPSMMRAEGYNRQTTGRVMLVFGTNAVAINSTKYFYIPVPPLAATQTLLVYIHNAITGNWFNRTITTTASGVAGNGIATISGPSTNDPAAHYTFYNYLKNNNSNCYIDLGVAPDNTSKMEMEFKVTSPGSSQYYSGSSVPSRYLVYAISGASADNYLTCHFFDDYISSESADGNPDNSILRNSGNKYRVTAEVMASATPNNYYLHTTFQELDASGNVIKMITKDSPAHAGGLIPSNFASGIPNIYVFAFNTTRKNPGMKLYSYKVWKNGELLYNFVPALDTDNGKKGVLNMVDYTFIEATGASGYSYTLGND